MKIQRENKDQNQPSNDQPNPRSKSGRPTAKSSIQMSHQVPDIKFDRPPITFISNNPATHTSPRRTYKHTLARSRFLTNQPHIPSSKPSSTQEKPRIPFSTVLVQILRAARAPPEYIQACRHFRCDACEDNKPKHQSTKVALPKDYVFGRNLGIDVLEVKDVVDEPYLCLNILDLGTTFQQVVLLRQGHGSPSSRECLDSFVSLWVGWAGWPQTLSCNRGVHNGGVFARTLAQHGVLIRQAGVESPEQIGRVERHGGLFKAVL